MDKGKDPKRDCGMKKTPMHLLPTGFLYQVSNVLGVGAQKYGEWNWREYDGVRASTYKGAILRHLCQWCDGEDRDSESGMSHLAHIAACCSILLDADKNGKLIDDREGR